MNDVCCRCARNIQSLQTALQKVRLETCQKAYKQHCRKWCFKPTSTSSFVPDFCAGRAENIQSLQTAFQKVRLFETCQKAYKQLCRKLCLEPISRFLSDLCAGVSEVNRAYKQLCRKLHFLTYFRLCVWSLCSYAKKHTRPTDNFWGQSYAQIYSLLQALYLVSLQVWQKTYR